MAQPTLSERPMSVTPTWTPLHGTLRDANPQVNSPLYGRIPPEVRDLIFEFAMSEYTKTEPESQFPVATDYTRPGYTGKKTVTFGLLLICRKTYLETWHLPMLKKEHVFWHDPARGPEQNYNFELWSARNPDAVYHIHREMIYFESLLHPCQLKFVKQIHLFTQAYWLEGSMRLLFEKEFMQGIEKVKITLRRGDWWWNETNYPLGINPKKGNGDTHEMKRDWALEKRGLVIPWKEDSWGCAFSLLPRLRELEMELETTEDKEEELDAIVEHAQKWLFPMKDGAVLKPAGEPKKWTWRGPVNYWSTVCPYCSQNNRRLDQRSSRRNNRRFCQVGNGARCAEKESLREQGLGPMAVVVDLKWRLVKEDGKRR